MYLHHLEQVSMKAKVEVMDRCTVLNCFSLVRTSHTNLTGRDAGNMWLQIDYLVSTVFIKLVSVGSEMETQFCLISNPISHSHLTLCHKFPEGQGLWSQGQMSGRALETEFHSSGLLVEVDHQESLTRPN